MLILTYECLCSSNITLDINLVINDLNKNITNTTYIITTGIIDYT